jgi:tyrosine phenol-lyase
MTSTPPFEPYRVKTIEPIRLSTLQERRQWLRDADFNLFRLCSDQVMIDLITDSGTGAMSSRQWSGIMQGDESYAGSQSYHRLAEVVRRITGMSNVLPTHQGRFSERLLVETLIGKSPEAGNGLVVPNNAHFDTTRYMIEASGAAAMNLLCIGGENPANTNPFKGNIDPRKLEQLLQKRGGDVPFVIITITCNSNGGQPVSLENLRTVREICDRHRKLLILDACRFAENAWFIKQREISERGRSIQSIVREFFDLADGAVMSTKKDVLCNIGGLLLLRDEQLHRKASSLCVLTDGFQMSYGSLPGRDLEAIALGLQEAIDEQALAARTGAVEELGQKLIAGGVEIVHPVGGHAIYLDAQAFCPHLSRQQQPAYALACAIYEHSGIRCTRIGSVMKNAGGEPAELVRLAIPRRTYTQAHLDYVARSVIELRLRCGEIQGVPVAAAVGAATMRQEPEFQAA